MQEVELDADIRKGKATQNQLRIFDSLLEIRIQIQKILQEANTLPQANFEGLFQNVEQPNNVPGESSSNNFDSVWKSCNSTVKTLLENLIGLQDIMTKQNPDVAKSILGKRKASGGNEEQEDQEIPSDEEITSEEDDDDDEAGDFKKSKKAKNGVDSDSNSDSEQLSGEEEEEDDDNQDEEEDDENDDENESEDASTPKKKIINDYDSEIQKRFQGFSKFRNETIQKWNDKTQIASGTNNKKNFSAFQTSTLSQIEHILKDKNRLFKRTQRKRSNNCFVIGKDKVENETEEYDEEIFDDDDFYHQLLRELIDRKTSNITDPVQLSRQWLQIQKLRSKLKRKVDTRASKGRKIRYDVHPKLVNYMASYDDSTMTDAAVKELYSSLFGNKKE